MLPEEQHLQQVQLLKEQIALLTEKVASLELQLQQCASVEQVDGLIPFMQEHFPDLFGKKMLDLKREDVQKAVEPIIEEQMHNLQQEFPDTYIRVVQKVFDTRIREKQDEIINIIYPRLGIIMRRYISEEMRLIKERVEATTRASVIYPFRALLGLFSKKGNSAEALIAKSADSQVMEAYAIQKGSGLIFGHYSSETTVDVDMVAGMLTVIKAFVEDGFHRSKEELQGIQYGNSNIVLFDSHTFYVAVVLVGPLSNGKRSALQDAFNKFATMEELNMHSTGLISKTSTKKVRRALAANFGKL